jgi:excisionase family DNA binding protein
MGILLKFVVLTACIDGIPAPKIKKNFKNSQKNISFSIMKSIYNKMMDDVRILRKLEDLENILLLVFSAGLDKKEILTIKEASIYCGIQVSSLRKLAANGKIKAYKPFGKLIFFRLDDIKNSLLKETK